MRKYTTWLIISFIVEIVLAVGAFSSDGDQSSFNVLFIFAIIAGIIFGLLFYFLPYAIARNRNVDNLSAVFLVNLLAGWFFIGWVAALIMGCIMQTKDRVEFERTVLDEVRGRHHSI
jgi:uncharacterized membrane protein YjjP (DUF1212 family)